MAAVFFLAQNLKGIFFLHKETSTNEAQQALYFSLFLKLQLYTKSVCFDTSLAFQYDFFLQTVEFETSVHSS